MLTHHDMAQPHLFPPLPLHPVVIPLCLAPEDAMTEDYAGLVETQEAVDALCRLVRRVAGTARLRSSVPRYRRIAELLLEASAEARDGAAAVERGIGA